MNDKDSWKEFRKKIREIKQRRQECKEEERGGRVDVEWYKSVIESRPSYQSTYDFKFQSVQERKSKIEEEQYKKSVFLLSKWEYIKQYKKQEFKVAEEFKQKRILAAKWYELILNLQ